MRGSNAKMVGAVVGACCVMGGGAGVHAAIMGTVVADYPITAKTFAGRASAVNNVLGVSAGTPIMVDASSDSNATKYLESGNPANPYAFGRWTSKSAGSVGTIAQAISGDDALEVVLSPSSPVTLTGVSLDVVFQNLPDVSHTTTWALYASLDGFATAPSDSGFIDKWTLDEQGTTFGATDDYWTSSKEVLLPATFANLSTPVTFRVYFASTLATSGNLMGVDNLKVYATPVPEPAAIGLIGCGAVALLSRRRRA